MFLRSVELTEYQKQLTKNKSWLSKTVVIAMAVHLLAILCCYSVLFHGSTAIVNVAKFALTIYVVLEIIATFILAFSFIVMQIGKFTLEKAKNDHLESDHLEEACDKFYKHFYKGIPLAQSWIYHICDVGVDMLVLATFITEGWFFTATAHVLCVLTQFALKRKLYSAVLTHLKTRTSPESVSVGSETMDQLMDKLFNGERA